MIFQQRLNKLRESLKLKGLDAAFVTKRENYFYLSGFTGTSAFLVITQSRAFLLTDFRYTEQALQEAPDYTTIDYKGKLSSKINEIVNENDIKVMGFEEEYVTFKTYNQYAEQIKVKEFKPLEGIISDLRIVKDNEEIEILKSAAGIGDDAFGHILKYIKPGVSELDVATELEYFMKKQGAKGQSFEIIVASGIRSAMPHGVASSKKLELGDVITLDFGCVYNEYCSDMTRTIFLGTPEPQISKIYDIVRKAQETALYKVESGYTGSQIDSIARNIISEEGYGDNFGHGLGHGVGIEVHEDPRISPRGEKKLENGMVITIEPGIYVEGLGGVRIEDMVVVSDNKPIILTKSTKEKIIL